MVEIESRSVLNGVDYFLSQGNMDLVDESVSEVFGMMLGFEITVGGAAGTLG